jgi:hypothetical protein
VALCKFTFHTKYTITMIAKFKSSLMALLLLSNLMLAQQQVTFYVEIPAGTTPTNVNVTGNWIAAAGLGSNWADSLVLSQLNGTNYYTGSANIPSGNYEYKFRTLDGTTTIWENVPSACSNAGTNRTFTVGTNAANIGPVCFSSCDAQCGAGAFYTPVSLTLRVDMTGVSRAIPTGCTQLDSINVTGDFGTDAGSTNWTPGSFYMTPISAGSKVYTTTINVKNKIYNFKFLRATDWTCSSTTPATQFSEQAESFTNASCVNNGGNRIINLSGIPNNGNYAVEYKWQDCMEQLFTNITDVQLSEAPAVHAIATGNQAALITWHNIATSQINKIIVSNAIGQVVVNTKNLQGNTLAINGLHQGVYYIQMITANNGSISSAFVQQ